MKKGIVIASFGTSVPEARIGIEAVEQILSQTAADYIAVRAFTSPTIRRVLAARGDEVPDLAKALTQLCAQGVNHVIV